MTTVLDTPTLSDRDVATHNHTSLIGSSITHLPSPGETPVGPRRSLRKATLDDKFNIVGALVASITLTSLLFGWFTPLIGGVGYVVVAFVLFVGFYIILAALRSAPQPCARDGRISEQGV